MNQHRFSPVKAYLTIAVLAIVAWLPVSGMMLALKNDVLSIEYPIQFFMSENLRQANFPLWMDSWAMGFPLQSVLTWGVYSTPRFIIGLVFGSSMYALHVEFILYSIASGCIMYKLLKTHFTQNREMAWLLACCYMLSGFAVGSGQWLLYLTGMTFIPLMVYCFLSLLKNPSLKYSILFAASWFLLLTNVHVYLTVLSFYSFVVLLLGLFIHHYLIRKETIPPNLYRYIGLAFFFTLLLCGAPAYYTYEVVSMLERKEPIVDAGFFQSNYLHPDGLSSLVYPLSSIKTPHPNTEGTVLDTYTGLLSIILLPISIHLAIAQRNKKALWLFIAAGLFLIISFGHLTPLRGWLNVLPGMGNFRHPGVLRIFYILCLVLFLATALGPISFVSLISRTSRYRKWVIFTVLSLLILSILLVVLNINAIASAWQGSIEGTLKNMTRSSLIGISAAIQIILLILFWVMVTWKPNLVKPVIAIDLIINTLICIPFFAVSSYSPKEVMNLLGKVEGNPAQIISPSRVSSTVNDGRNSFYNTNVFTKQVSTDLSMPGPLVLENVSKFLDSDSSSLIENRQLIFIVNQAPGDSVILKKQIPGKLEAEIKLVESREIILQQANYPGWKAFYNTRPLALENDRAFVTAMVPAGEGKLHFKFSKPGVMVSALVLHIIILMIGGFVFIKAMTRK